MKRYISVFALALTACLSNLAKAGDLEFFDALAQQESHDRPLDYKLDVNGVSVVGYFQISEAYWSDAMKANPSLGGTWDRCRYDKGYAEEVILAYMSRYVPEALEKHDYEVIARTHNGGPKGAKHSSTLSYWNAVKARMTKGSE